MNKQILYAQPIFGKEEIKAVLTTLKKGWLGNSVKSAEFERKVAKLYGKKFGLFVNSGTSANILAMILADLPKGSEVITQACTFPSTLSPILLYGLIPVFVDSEMGTYNINLNLLEKAISKKTKAIFISHTLGNVNDMVRLRKICDKHHLILIEDSCDTVGSKWSGKPTGIWSDIVTTSFYASHHITAAGGGGMLMVNDKKLANKALALRDWGKDLTGKDKPWHVTYSDMAYNFKPLEIQAAFGLVQLNKLSKFNAIRKNNFDLLNKFFRKHESMFVLPRTLPQATVSWLAFPLTIRKNVGFNRDQIVKHLAKNGIQSKPLFAGNILKQPGYKNILHRTYGKLTNADYIMENSFMIGIHQGLSKKDMDYVCTIFDKFLRK